MLDVRHDLSKNKKKKKMIPRRTKYFPNPDKNLALTQSEGILTVEALHGITFSLASRIHFGAHKTEQNQHNKKVNEQ